ncbi:MAG: hypothetical protein U0V75_10780 [Ferruginibacter sp.]
MKRLLISLLFLALSVPAFCQADTTPPYLKTKLRPSFNMLSTDSVVFNQSVLKGNLPTVIMLFNPECGHCQEQLKTFLSIPGFAGKVQLLLSSTETLAKIKLFSEKFQLEKYPNILIGKDHKYFFGGFYQPKTIPVLAVYDSNNKLVFFNQGNVSRKQLQKLLH